MFPGFGHGPPHPKPASRFTAPGTEADGCFDKGEDLDACYLGSAEVANATRPFFDWYVVRVPGNMFFVDNCWFHYGYMRLCRLFSSPIKQGPTHHTFLHKRL